MLHRLEMAQGYVVPVVEAVENCSTCFHCDGNTAPICGWLRDTQLHHNILPLPDICTYFQYIHSTCKEIFPTWVDAEERLTRLVEGSAYVARITSGPDNTYKISLMSLPDQLDIPDEYMAVVEQILNEVTSEYYPSLYILKPFLNNLQNFICQIELRQLITAHLLTMEYSGGVTLKEALRRAFGLGLMRCVSVECKITCDGEQFEKK